jgi:hypothetical protein
MNFKIALLGSVVLLNGCAVDHVHHFKNGDMPGCNCGANAVNSGHNLPVDYSKAKILPPIYQPVQAASPYAPNAASHYPALQYAPPAPPPQPKVQMPEYYRLSPVDPNEMQHSAPQQSAPPAQGYHAPQGPYYRPAGYNQPYYGGPQAGYPPQYQQPAPQPVMPISMHRTSNSEEESNIRTYLFQPAGGVVFQY